MTVSRIIRRDQQHIINRADATADALEKVVHAAWGEILRLLQSSHHHGGNYLVLSHRLRHILQPLAAQLVTTLAHNLAHATTAAHDQAVDQIRTRMTSRQRTKLEFRKRLRSLQTGLIEGIDTDSLHLFSPMQPSLIHQILYADSWASRIASLTSLAAPDLLASIIAQGVQQGKTIDQIAREIRPHVQGVQTSARRVARTECLTADAVVDAANVSGAFRRWYRGPVIKIVTKSGRKLTGTPNHPVLTLRGWIALADLDKSDDLICNRGDVKNMRSSGNEDVAKAPSTIRDIFDSLSAVGVRSRARTGKPDFHGDGMDGNVDILSARCVLRYGRMATRHQLRKQFGFTESYLMTGDASQLNGCSPSLWVVLSKGVRIGLSTEYNSAIKEAFSNDATIDLVLSHQSSKGPSGMVFEDHGIDRKIAIVVGLLPGESLSLGVGMRSGYPNLTSKANDNVGLASHEFGDLDSAQPGLVEMDRLQSLVRVEDWFGHVFNLQTEDGYYVCNGLYTKNCVRVSHEAQLQAWEQAAEIITGYQVHSVHGNPNSRWWHLKRDGTIYHRNPGPGQKGFYQMPRPPREPDDPNERPPGTPQVAPNCLCYLTPVMDE